jgi:hypothetical protein
MMSLASIVLPLFVERRRFSWVVHGLSPMKVRLGLIKRGRQSRAAVSQSNFDAIK